MSAGIPSLTIVGLPDAIEESKERVRLALKNLVLNFPKENSS